MSKRACSSGEGMKKGGWTSEEDKKLISYIHEHGEGRWPDIPQKAGLNRTGKSCRLRWINYLKPELKSGGFSHEEEQIIIILHASHGNNWSVIASHLPKRTEKDIENYWNTHLKKRFMDNGTDTVTHKQLASSPSSAEPKNFDSEEEPYPDVKSYPSSESPISLSRFNNTTIEISNDEMPLQSGFLRCKKRFDRSSSTSRLLNKVASIGKTLSSSMEATLRSHTSSSCLPNSLSQSSKDMIDNKEDLSRSIDLIDIPQCDFSQFLDQFMEEDNNQYKNNLGGYNQDFLMYNVPSNNVDEDNMIEDITDWSSYLLDQTYETVQDSNHKNHFCG